MPEGEELPYFSASSSNMNMRIVPGAVTFQNIDEMTKVRLDTRTELDILYVYLNTIYISYNF